MADNSKPLDSLKIIVKGENEDAVKKIDALISKLTSISQAAQNTNKGLNSYSNAMKKLSAAMSNVDGDKISTMANALSGLSNLNNVKISSTIPKRISEIGAAVENVDVSKVDKLVQSLGGLQGLSALSGASLSSVASAPATAPSVENNLSGTVEMSGGTQTVEVESTTAAVEEQTATVERNSQAWARLQTIATKAANGLKVAAIGAAKGVGDFAKNLALAPFKSFSAKIEKASGAISNLGKVIKKRVLYRLINAAISAITKSFKEGTNNIYQYSKALGTAFAPNMDKMSTSALYLKNALGSLVAPLVNAVAPAIDFVIDKFVDLLNVVSQTIAKLTGASVWSKAVKYPTTYADAADKATAANKKFKASLLGIDEINKLNDNSDNGGGAGGNNLDYSKMFVETPVDAVGKLGDLFKPIKDSYNKNIAPMKAKVEKALGNIKKLIGDVGKSFSEVWQNGTGTETFDHIFGILGGCVELAGNLAAKLDEAWTANGNGTAQLQSIWNIYNSILGIVDDLVNDTAEWVETLDLTSLADSITLVLESFDKTFAEVRTFASEVNKNIIQPILKPIVEEWLPKINEKVADMQTKISEVFGKINEKMPQIKEAVESVSNIISRIKDYLQPIIDGIDRANQSTKNFLADSGLDTIELTIENIAGLLKIIKGIITLDPGESFKGWEQILSSNWEALKDGATDTFAFVKGAYQNVGETAKDTWSTMKESASDAWSNIKEFFSPAAEWFNEKFSKVKEALAPHFHNIGVLASGCWQLITLAFGKVREWFNEHVGTPIKNVLSDAWDKIKQGASKAWEGIKTVFSPVTNWFKDKFSEAWSKVKQVFSVGGKIFDGIKEGITAAFTTVVNAIINGMNRVIAMPFNAINNAIDKLRNANILGLTPFADLVNISVPQIPLIGSNNSTYGNRMTGVQQYANGGFPTTGELFLSRENGLPEFVGQIGNRTAVANNDQIVDSVSSGVADANREQNSILYDILDVIRVISQKDYSGGSTDIFAEISRRNRQDGTTIIPMGV